MTNELCHHGILGQRWGKRNGPPYPLSGSKKHSRKKSSDDSEKSESKSDKKKENTNPRKMTDQELTDRIKRLELEKKYSKLMSDVSGRARGKAFVMRVLEKSGENIAVQLTTDVMGIAVNKAFGKLLDDPKIVNPKKGQKDK